MNGIDPKWGLWVSGVGFLLTFLSATSTSFPDYIPAGFAEGIRQTAHFLSPMFEGLSFIIFGGSSNKPGPFVSSGPSVPMVPPKASISLLAGLGAVLLLLAVSAQRAEAKSFKVPLPPMRGKIIPTALKVQTPDQIAGKVLSWVSSDAAADLALAIKIGTKTNNQMTLPCFKAVNDFVSGLQELPTADQMPKVHIAVDIEIISDLINAVQPNSPAFLGCSALATATGAEVGNMITGIVTGAVALGKLPIAVP